MSTLLTLAKLAAEAGLPFLVIGGNAVIAHGYQRGTKDVDLLVPDIDLNKWDSLIRGLGYTTLFSSHAFEQYVFPDHKLAPVDLLVVSTDTFAKLTASPMAVSFEGASFQIPRLSHLFALKLQAMRDNPAKRFERDMGDILELMRINRITLEMPEHRAIFDRYATSEIRRELERRLAGPPSA